jgi:hypothetical protein
MSVALNIPAAAWVAGLSLLGLFIYLIAALALVRAPLRIYCALIYAPIYLMWKIWVYARAFAMPRSQRWVRTQRTPAPDIV